MKEYDLFVPLRYNDGAPVEPEKLRAIQNRLREQFGGLTFFPQANEGLWRAGDVEYRDEIVIYRILAAKERSARRFLSRLKEDLKRDLKQQEVLIVERDVETL